MLKFISYVHKDYKTNVQSPLRKPNPVDLLLSQFTYRLASQTLDSFYPNGIFRVIKPEVSC